MITLYGRHTIYLVVDDAPEGTEVKAAFTTRAAAKRFIKEQGAELGEFLVQYYEVQPFTLRTK